MSIIHNPASHFCANINLVARPRLSKAGLGRRFAEVARGTP